MPGLGVEAGDHLAPFLGWLADANRELGIDERTELDATPGSWVLVVNRYQFVSAEWEIGLAWYVMIPPDDWARRFPPPLDGGGVALICAEPPFRHWAAEAPVRAEARLILGAVDDRAVRPGSLAS